MSNSQGSNLIIARNTVVLYVRMLVIMIVSLYISRVLLKALGIEDFGTYSIVGGVTSLFSFLMSAMSISTQRFLSYELGKGCYNEMKKIFSTSVAIHLLIAAVFFILAETAGLFIVYKYLDIPLGRELAAHVCYQFTILTMVFHIFSVPFTATVITYEKMGVYAYVSIIDILLKLGIAISIAYLSGDRLIFYAALLAIESAIVFLIYYFYCKRCFEICVFRRSLCSDRSLFKRLLGFTGWNFLGQSAMVVSNQGVNIILNAFAGVVVNAAMGIANQVNSAVMSLVYNFQTAFRPRLTKTYAQGKTKDLHSLIYLATKVSFFLVFVVAFPLGLNIEWVLSAWLTEVPQYTAEFCVLILIYSLIESICGPLFISISATGNIKTYQIIVSLLLSLNLILSYLFLALKYPFEVVLVIKIVVNIILLLYRIAVCRKQVELSASMYFKQVLLRLIVMSTIVISLYLLIINVLHSINVASSFILSITLTCVLMFFVGLNKYEQHEVLGLCQKLLKKR